jgi:transcriptional regulator with XRE-family HTH domain
VSSTAEQFGKRVHQLRKDRGWSQPELGKKIGTSGAIVGRYERGEMTPSIEVALKIAQVFRVTLDALVSESELPDMLGNQDMLDRWKALDALPVKERDRILDVLDSLARDAQARIAYGKAS